MESSYVGTAVVSKIFEGIAKIFQMILQMRQQLLDNRLKEAQNALTTAQGEHKATLQKEAAKLEAAKAKNEELTKRGIDPNNPEDMKLMTRATENVINEHGGGNEGLKYALSPAGQSAIAERIVNERAGVLPEQQIHFDQRMADAQTQAQQFPAPLHPIEDRLLDKNEYSEFHKELSKDDKKKYLSPEEYEKALEKRPEIAKTVGMNEKQFKKMTEGKENISRAEYLEKVNKKNLEKSLQPSQIKLEFGK